jgi:hypothetical protein
MTKSQKKARHLDARFLRHSVYKKAAKMAFSTADDVVIAPVLSISYIRGVVGTFLASYTTLLPPPPHPTYPYTTPTTTIYNFV